MNYCPDATSWNKMLEGRSSPTEQSTLTRHLEDCSRCQQTMERLTRCDPCWSESARHDRGPRPALMRAIDSLKGAGEYSMSTAGQDTIAYDDLSFLDRPSDAQSMGRLGKHDVLEIIGRGGMGIVLKAFEPARSRTVAIKVLAPQLATHPTARQRFEREATVARAVEHDNVVAIHEVSEINGVPFIVMEFVDGTSLQDRLDRNGPPDLEDIIRIGMQTAAGLAAAHDQGLIHRDIKPANILLDGRHGDVKLTDFGLARAVDDATLTQSGVIAGTPQYMAPEQARGWPLDHRADLFSLGSVLYALCTGRPPFRAPSTLAVLKRVCEETPPPIRDLNPDIPHWLVEIIDRLLEKHPGDRYESAAKVARLLEKQLRQLTIASAASPRRPARRLRVEARTPWLAWGLSTAGVGMALLIACCAIGVWIGSSEPPPAPQPVVRKEEPKPALAQVNPAPAIEQPAAVPVVLPLVKRTGDAVIDGALDEIAQMNPITSRDAARRLASMEPKHHRATVAKRLEELAGQADLSLRREFLHALAVWATEKEVPTLVKGLGDQDVFSRREILKSVGKLRDKRTIDPVVICFIDFHTRKDAAAALRDLGALAETAVLALLDHADVFTRQGAIEVLRDIGTQESVPTLQRIIGQNQAFLADAARDAVDAINARAQH